jgi:hypothetical protein
MVLGKIAAWLIMAAVVGLGWMAATAQRPDAPAPSVAPSVAPAGTGCFWDASAPAWEDNGTVDGLCHSGPHAAAEVAPVVAPVPAVRVAHVARAPRVARAVRVGRVRTAIVRSRVSTRPYRVRAVRPFRAHPYIIPAPRAAVKTHNLRPVKAPAVKAPKPPKPVVVLPVVNPAVPVAAGGT